VGNDIGHVAAGYPIVSGPNGFLPGIPAWHAKPGYNLASGLGVSSLDRSTAPCPQPPRPTNTVKSHPRRPRTYGYDGAPAGSYAVAAGRPVASNVAS
jgi:hypothetical protein